MTPIRVGTTIRIEARFSAILTPNLGLQPAWPTTSVVRWQSPTGVVTEVPMIRVDGFEGFCISDFVPQEAGTWGYFVIGSGSVVVQSALGLVTVTPQPF